MGLITGALKWAAILFAVLTAGVVFIAVSDHSKIAPVIAAIEEAGCLRALFEKAKLLVDLPGVGMPQRKAGLGGHAIPV